MKKEIENQMSEVRIRRSEIGTQNAPVGARRAVPKPE